MALSSKDRNDLARVALASTPADASAKVIADLESLQRRVNAILRKLNINTGMVAAITNAPPDGGSGGSGASGTFGPLPTLSFANGLLQSGSSLSGTANGQMLVWDNDTSTWNIVAMSGDGTLSKAGALTLINRLTAGSAGSATTVPVITWNAKGFLTAVTTATISGTVPDGTTSQILIWSGTAWVARTASGDLTNNSTGTFTLASIISASSAGSATQVPVITWDAKGRLTVVSTATITGTVPNGSSAGQILYWNGSAWVVNTAGSDKQTLRMNGTVPTFSSQLQNDGSTIFINAPLTSTTCPLVAFYAGSVSDPDGFEISDAGAAHPTALAIINSGNGATIRMGLSGAANQWFTGTAQKDGIFYLSTDNRLWFGTNNLAKMVLDSTGLIIGSSAAAGAKLDVTAQASGVAGLFTGVTGQVTLKVVGIGGTTVPSLRVQADANACLDLITTGGLCQLYLQTSVTPVASTNLGGVYGRGLQSATSTVLNGAAIIFQASDTWDATHSSGALIFQTTPTGGSTTLTARVKIDANGNVILNQTGSALATSATNGFTYLPNCAGVPSGTPAALPTGASAFVEDTTHNTLWVWNTTTSTWVTPKHRLVINNYTGTALTTSKTMDALTDYQSADSSSGGAIGVTLPDAATRGSAPVYVKNLVGGAATVTVNRAGSDTIDGGTTGVALTTGQRAMFVANGTDWQRLGA